MSSKAQIVRPVIGKDVFIAPTAYVGGDVTIGDQCTILHQAVIRGDVASITIGRRVNVQDAVVIHTKNEDPLTIGDDVGIGHRAVVHCRKIGARTLIGIGAIVLDECEIGEGCIIAAGAVVPPGTCVPPGKLVVGVPGRIVRDVDEKYRGYIDFVRDNYVRLGRDHAAGKYPNWDA